MDRTFSSDGAQLPDFRVEGIMVSLKHSLREMIALANSHTAPFMGIMNYTCLAALCQYWLLDDPSASCV